MPALFLGHGSPMNALEVNHYTRAWRALGASMPRPRAVVVVSAHWYIDHTAVTAMARPRTIHDFFGFPPALFDLEYAAPGEPGVAEEVAELAKPDVVGLDRDSWGLDHGAWSVLVHLFPKADVPVLQLSIDARRPLDWHLDLGARLAPLQERGVLVLASGNVVHNLRAIDWGKPDSGFDWAVRFNDAARAILTERPEAVGELRRHPDYVKSVPTAEHFLPLIYVAGMAHAVGRPLSVLLDGYAYGSLSMACYGLDASSPDASDPRPAARMADPAIVAPENSNT
jgi:4,5-DOPA dioxygenase extradiol